MFRIEFDRERLEPRHTALGGPPFRLRIRGCLLEDAFDIGQHLAQQPTRIWIDARSRCQLGVQPSQRLLQ